MALISIGNCSKYNIYFLISILCYLLMDLTTGFNPSNSEKPVRFFPSRPKIKKHIILEKFLLYASCFFGGLILYCLEKSNKIKNTFDTPDEVLLKMNSMLINKNDNVRIDALAICFIYALYLILQGFMSKIGAYIGFWTIEILYLCLFSRRIFNIKINRHRKLAIYIMSGLAVIELIGFFFPMTKHENKENFNDLTDKNVFEIIIIKYGAYAIPLIFLANELIHVQRDYCWIRSKYLMDVKLYPPSKILMIIGSFGFILIIIFFSIFTYAPCKTFNNINKINDTYINIDTNEPLELYKEYCSLTEYDENSKILYLLFDSFKLVIKDYSNMEKDDKLEIFLVIPLLFILNLVNEVTQLLMIRYTDPNNILIYRNIYFFLQTLVQMIINQGDEQYQTYLQFFIIEFEDFASIIGNMIYIEVLELNFCKLDYDLKKNITLRGNKDIKKNSILELDKGSLSLDDDDDEDGGFETESEKSSRETKSIK